MLLLVLVKGITMMSFVNEWTILMVAALFQGAKFTNNRPKKMCASQAACPISNEHVMVKKSSNWHFEFVVMFLGLLLWVNEILSVVIHKMLKIWCCAFPFCHCVPEFVFFILVLFLYSAICVFVFIVVFSYLRLYFVICCPYLSSCFVFRATILFRFWFVLKAITRKTSYHLHNNCLQIVARFKTMLAATYSTMVLLSCVSWSLHTLTLIQQDTESIAVKS